MNRRQVCILGTIVSFAVLVAGGLVAAHTGNRTAIDKKLPVQHERTAGDASPGSNDFILVATSGLSFRATVQRDYVGDQFWPVMLMDRDGVSGVSRLTSKAHNRVTAKVFFGEGTYACDREACEKMIWRSDAPYADNTMQFDYDFLPGAVDQLKSRVTFKGEANCPAGRCHVWEAAPGGALSESYSQVLFIDTHTKRISKVIRTYTRTGSAHTITYDYQPLTITLPPLPEELPEL